MRKKTNLSYFGEKNDEKKSMTKNHRKKTPKNSLIIFICPIIETKANCPH